MGDLDQQLKDAQAAPSHKNYSDRKRAAMLKLHNQPLCPRLAQLLLICLLVITGALTVAEFFHSRGLSGSGSLLRSLSITGLGIWCLYAIPLVLVCVVGMCSNRRRFYKKQADSEIFSETDSNRQRDRRAIRRLNRTYIVYIVVGLSGILLWGLLFLFAR